MYVVRPHLFIPIITLLSQLGGYELSERQDRVSLVRRRKNIDITNFENELNTFK
jgi:hypothetical protein